MSRAQVYGLRALQRMMRDAPPMAAYYQKLATIHDDKSLRRAKARGVL